MSAAGRHAPTTPFAVGDRITLRKAHPCGGSEWEVYRIGADIGLACLTCGRRMMVSRARVAKRMRSRVAVATGSSVRPPSPVQPPLGNA